MLAAWQAGLLSVITAQPLLDELARTFEKPYFVRALRSEQRQANLAFVRNVARLVPLTVTVEGVASHPADDIVLATALSGGACFLITSDHQLQKLGEYQGLIIVSAAQFIAMLPGLLVGESRAGSQAET